MADQTRTPDIPYSTLVDMKRQRLVEVPLSAGAASTAGEPIGLLLALTKAS